jgi:8-oxo-dGTP pyrophosphatase MutT (NUDIX family)
MPFDAVEHAHTQRVIAFLQNETQPFARSTRSGHITGSAFLVDVAQQNTLLIWHTKLQRWLQPGGHCEPDIDANVAATALREALEETDLPASAVQLFSPRLFDVDVHRISAHKDEPDHWHYDIRFLFTARTTAALPQNGQWVSLHSVATWPEASLARMAQKCWRAV